MPFRNDCNLCEKFMVVLLIFRIIRIFSNDTESVKKKIARTGFCHYPLVERDRDAFISPAAL